MRRLILVGEAHTRTFLLLLSLSRLFIRAVHDLHLRKDLTEAAVNQDFLEASVIDAFDAV